MNNFSRDEKNNKDKIKDENENKILQGILNDVETNAKRSDDYSDRRHCFDDAEDYFGDIEY